MRRDPFLNRLFIAFDRLAAWLWLVLIIGALLWSATWQNGFTYSGDEAIRLFLRFATGKADRATSIIGILIFTAATALASLISVWLFNRWRRAGELGKQHLRGTWLEGEQ